MFSEIRPEELSGNPFQLIGKDWMLITCGNQENFNTMTASWGGLGVLWNKNVCFTMIRPQRYTYEFMEKNNLFTLSFYEEQYRDALKICGSKSGRDIDKPKVTGLTPYELSNGSMAFSEARIILCCRKLYYQDMEPNNFLVPEINQNYTQKDYHRVYIGEILNCYLK